MLIGRQSTVYNQNYPIQRGTPYTKLKGLDQALIDLVSEFQGNPLYFLKEIRPGNTASADFGTSDLMVLWIFATQQLGQSQYCRRLIRSQGIFSSRASRHPLLLLSGREQYQY